MAVNLFPGAEGPQRRLFMLVQAAKASVGAALGLAFFFMLGQPDTAELVAFAGLWLMADEAHITTFAVHPSWRRQGVAHRLMVRLVELSRQIGAQRMTLEVRVSNLAAQSLYRRFGFVVVGRRPRYYTDDAEDALIMTTPELGGPSMQALLLAEGGPDDVADSNGGAA